MKNKLIIILWLVLNFLSTKSLTIDYNNFYYYNFFNLTKDFTQQQILSAYKPLELKYHPDKSAQNFIQKNLFESYSKLLKKVKEILLSKFDRVEPAFRPFGMEPPYSQNEIRLLEARLETLKKQFGKDSQQYKDVERELKGKNAANEKWADQKAKYGQYEMWKKLNKKINQPVDIQDLELKIKIDFYELMKKQVQQKFLNSTEIQRFYFSISTKISEDFKDIVGAIYSGNLGNISSKLKEEENKLTQELADISPTNENKIKSTIIEAFFYSYLNQRIRDTSVEALIKLAHIYKDQKNIQKANSILTKMKNIIETEWGTVFPIEDRLKNEIELLGKFEIAEIPTKALAEVNKLLQNVKSKFSPEEFNPLYQQAIEKLKPSLPISAPNILEIYLTWAIRQFDPNWKAYVLYLALLDAGTFEASAQAKNLPISEKFVEEKDKIQQALLALPEESKQKATLYIGQLGERKIPKEKLDEVNNLIDNAKTKEIQEAVKDFLNTIEILMPFTPQTSAKIINTYLLIIRKYNNINDSENAKKFMLIAQIQAQNLGLITPDTQKFTKAKQDLATEAEKIGVTLLPIPTLVPVPAPIPIPTPDLDSNIKFRNAVRNLDSPEVKRILNNVTDQMELNNALFILGSDNQAEAKEIIIAIRRKTTPPQANPNFDRNGMTILMQAAGLGISDIIKELLSFPDIQINKKNPQDGNKTALDYAQESIFDREKKIKILQIRGAKTATELVGPIPTPVPPSKVLGELNQLLIELQTRLTIMQVLLD